MATQAANDALPTAELKAFGATASLKKQRFRNWKLMAIELAIALFGFYVFAVTRIGPPVVGIVSGAGGIVALWLFRRELSGISIDSKTLQADPMDALLVVSATKGAAVRSAPIDTVGALVRI
jgi:hypothetical protein